MLVVWKENDAFCIQYAIIKYRLLCLISPLVRILNIFFCFTIVLLLMFLFNDFIVFWCDISVFWILTFIILELVLSGLVSFVLHDSQFIWDIILFTLFLV